MATVTMSYKRAIVQERYSRDLVANMTDLQISAAYDKMVKDSKRPYIPKRTPPYERADRQDD